MFQKKVFIGIVIVILVLVSLCGCTSSDQHKIVGSWKRMNWDSDQIWSFEEDGMINMSTNSFEIYYGFDDGKLWIFYPNLGYLDTFEYTFENDDVLTLDLADDDDIIINKTSGPVTDSPYNHFLFHRVS